MKLLSHSAYLALALSGCLLASPSASSAEVHLELSELKAGSILESLPQNAIAHVQINNGYAVLEGIEQLVAAAVPEQFLPEEQRQLLELEHPLLTVLGMQWFGAPLTKAEAAERIGIALDQPVSLTVYPGLPARSFLLTLPLADLARFEGFLKMSLGGGELSSRMIGAKQFFRFPVPHPMLKSVVMAAREDRVFISGDESLLMQVFADNSQARLADDPASKRFFDANAGSDIWLAVNPSLSKAFLPFVEIFRYAPLAMVAEKRAELLAKIRPQEREMIEQRLRVQWGIKNLEQAADYVECFIAASYDELTECLLSQIKAFNGFSLGLNLDGSIVELSSSVLSDQMTPESCAAPIPLGEVRSALAKMPQAADHFSISGRHPAPVPVPCITSWLARLEKNFQARELNMTVVEALKRLHFESVRPASISVRSPWTARVMVPVDPLRAPKEFESVKAFALDAAGLLAYPLARPVTLLPSAENLLEEVWKDKMQALQKNNELAENVFFPKGRLRWVDQAYRVHQAELQNGVSQVTWETAFLTRGGLFGFNQHELVSRRIFYSRDVRGYTLFHQASRTSDWITTVSMTGSHGLTPGLNRLLDRVPEGANHIRVHRFVNQVPGFIEWLMELEDLLHRDLGQTLDRAKEIAAGVSDPDQLASKMAGLEFSPLIYSINKDRQSGEIYGMIPGGVTVPRPQVTPLLGQLIEKFSPETADQSGILLYTRAGDGFWQGAVAHNTAALAGLLKTIGNALHTQYLSNPEAMRNLRQRIIQSRDTDPERFDEIVARNPIWEFLPRPRGSSGPKASQKPAAPLHPIPARAQDTPPALLDLSAHYNAALDDSWHAGGYSGNTLSELPKGVREMAGVKFDVRGIVQLSGRDAAAQLNVSFPEEVTGIPVGQACQKLHLLHATGWRAEDGTVIGQIRLHYADGQTREIPIVYGTHVRDWWSLPTDSKVVAESEVAWTGKNEASANLSDVSLRLYRTTWQNPRAGEVIERLDYKSTMSVSAPYLIAISLE